MDKKQREQFKKEIDRQATRVYERLEAARILLGDTRIGIARRRLDQARDEMGFLLSCIEAATAIILGDWPGKPEGDDITGIQSGKNYGNTGFSGGCTQPCRC